MSSPYSPCPATRSFLPSSNPAGTLTSMSRSPTRRPIVPPSAAVRNGTRASTSMVSGGGCGRPRPRARAAAASSRTGPRTRRRRRRPAAAEHPAEHLLGHLGIDLLAAAAAELEDPPPGTQPRPARRDVGPELVVHRLLLRVAQHVVGVLDLLEPGLGLLVAGVAVGVVLAGQLAVRLRDLVGGGGLRDARGLRNGRAA